MPEPSDEDFALPPEVSIPDEWPAMLQAAPFPALTGALFDETTYQLARIFLTGERGEAALARHYGLPAIGHATSAMLECLVLHDRIVVGEGFSLDLGTFGLFDPAAEVRLGERAKDCLLDLARHEALRAAEFNEVAEALGDGVGRDDLLAEVAGIPRVAYRTSRGAYFNARLHGFLDGSSHDIRRAERARPTRPRTSARSAGGALLARAMFYLLLADRYGCVYRSDSIRAGVIDAAVKEASRRSFAELVVRDLEKLERARDEDLNRALRFEAMPSPLPMVADAIIQRAGSRDECLTIALEVRQSRQARRFREFCGTVELAIHEGDRPRVEKALADLRRYGLRLTGTVGPATDPAPARELISYASPLAGALFAVLRTPVIEIVDQLRNRRFALLDEVRNSQRGTVAQRRMAEFWTTL